MKNQKNVPITDAWAGKADCKNCQIRDSALFSGLNESDFTQIHSPITQTTLKAGEQLYSMGQKGEHIFTIRKGMIKLTQFLSGGNQRIVRILQASDVLGTEALLGRGYQQEATALQETEVCHIPITVIKSISQVNSELQNTLLDRCHLALSHADYWLTELSTGSAKQRVARLLLFITEKNKNKQCRLCSREDIGAMLGITIETASRTIADFKRKGYITEIDTKTVMCDIDALQELAKS